MCEDKKEILLQYISLEESEIVEDFIQRLGFKTCRKNMGEDREAVYLVVPKTDTKVGAYYELISKIFSQVISDTLRNNDVENTLLPEAGSKDNIVLGNVGRLKGEF